MSHIPYSEISSISLFPLGNQDNEIDSHVRVMHHDSMRGSHPYPYGIYDAHLGSTSHEWACDTCGQYKQLCPGHFGAIYLNCYVPSPFFTKDILKWLKTICFNCGKLLIAYKKLPIRKDKILSEYVKLTTRATNKNMLCIHCNAIHPHISKDKNDPISIFMELYDTKSISNTKGQLLGRAPLLPHMIKAIFDKISDKTLIEMGKPLFAHPRKFTINVVKVPPNSIRPDIKKIGGGKSNNNDLTVLLQAIVKINDEIPSTIPANPDQDLEIKIHNLSLAVYDLIKGSSSANKRSIVNNSKKPLTSIAKRFPRKYGRIRRNLMGRRASHMARSFITCDPSLKIDELGVPLSIAKNIQIPEIVREYNYDEMLIYFMNGIKRYPGSTKVKKASTGKTHFIDKVEKLEIGDTIYRDVINGDIAGFNRQPSLEPSSISSMRVVIMEKGETIRINVLSCPLFNADFDGDERYSCVSKSRLLVSYTIYLSDKQFKIVLLS